MDPGGPPAAIFLNLRRHTHQQLRATIATTGSANLLFRLIGFTIAGLYASPAVLVSALCLLPVAWLSVTMADRLRSRISDAAILKATYSILIFSAVSLTIRAALMS